MTDLEKRLQDIEEALNQAMETSISNEILINACFDTLMGLFPEKSSRISQAKKATKSIIESMLTIAKESMKGD